MPVESLRAVRAGGSATRIWRREGYEYAGRFTLGVPIAEGHPAVLTDGDILFPDDTSVPIASEIDQGFFATTDGFDINHPFPRIRGREINPCFAKGFEHFGTEDFCKGFVTEEKTFGFFGAPQAFIRFDGGRRHDQMDMRMVIEASCAGVQDGDGPGIALQLRVVAREGFNRFPTAAGQGGIQRALMLPSQSSEFFGQSEGRQKIIGGYLFLELAFQPLLTFVGLAVWTTTMAAGMGYQDLAFAVIAVCQHQRALRSPAVLHNLQGLTMARQNPVVVPGWKFRLKCLDD